MQKGPLRWWNGEKIAWKDYYGPVVHINLRQNQVRWLRQAVLPSDMLLRICRKHMSRFLISSRSSLSQRSTVLPRADAHWFWCTGRKKGETENKWKRESFSDRAQGFKEIKKITQLKLQRWEMSNIFLVGEEKKKHICCSSSVLWDSNINCRFEETHLQHLRTEKEEWKRLRGQLNLRIGESTHTHTHTHTPWCGTLRGEKCWGGTLGRLYRYLQTTEGCMFWSLNWNSLNYYKSPICWILYNCNQKSLVDTKVKQNTCIGMFSSWFPSTLWPAACLSLSLSCGRSGRGTERREKSTVTRLVARVRGGTRSSGSRGRGGTLTECLLVNLSLLCREVTE